MHTTLRRCLVWDGTPDFETRKGYRSPLLITVSSLVWENRQNLLRPLPLYRLEGHIKASVTRTAAVMLRNIITNYSLMAPSCQSWSTNSWCVSVCFVRASRQGTVSLIDRSWVKGHSFENELFTAQMRDFRHTILGFNNCRVYLRSSVILWGQGGGTTTLSFNQSRNYEQLLTCFAFLRVYFSHVI